MTIFSTENICFFIYTEKEKKNSCKITETCMLTKLYLYIVQDKMWNYKTSFCKAADICGSTKENYSILTKILSVTRIAVA